jgi:UDP-glucose 4-epimerase
MKSHVVIGGSGFLGRHVVRSLVQRSDDVHVVDLAAFRPDGDGLSPKYTAVDLSAATPSDFDGILGNAEIVHHFAWSTIPQTADADPAGDLEVNLGITLRLLEAMRRRGGGTLVFPSSGGTVYGRLQMIPVPETHPLVPITAYGASKAAAEMYLNIFRDRYGIDARVARIANPFGAGQNPAKPQGVASTIAFRALANQSVEIWGSGNVIRDFIHVQDAVAGFLALADASNLESSILPVYNIGSGKGASVNEIIATVERHIGRPIRILHKSDRPFDVPISVLDISKAKNDLHWSPVLNIDSGIEQMIVDLRADPARLFSSFSGAAS